MPIEKNYRIDTTSIGFSCKNSISVQIAWNNNSDYRGEIKVILINLGNNNFEITHGLRIAQMVLCPVIKANIEEVQDLDTTDRGKGGFGSTGV